METVLVIVALIVLVVVLTPAVGMLFKKQDKR